MAKSPTLLLLLTTYLPEEVGCYVRTLDRPFAATAAIGQARVAAKRNTTSNTALRMVTEKMETARELELRSRGKFIELISLRWEVGCFGDLTFWSI